MIAEHSLPYDRSVPSESAGTIRRPSAGTGELRSFAAGRTIHDVATPATRVYAIARGEVRLLEDGPNGCARLVEIFGPGDWLGAAALAGMPTCGKRAVAMTEVLLVERSVDEYLLWLEQNPPAAVALVRELAKKLHATRTAASRFVFDDCRRRVLKTLVEFAATAASTPLDGGSVRLRITHRDLAEAIGVARETVSLALSDLKKGNLVETGRGNLTFTPAKLTSVLESGDDDGGPPCRED